MNEVKVKAEVEVLEYQIGEMTTKRTYRYQVEKLVAEYARRTGIAYYFQFSYCAAESKDCWNLVPFGRNSFSIGKTLAEAKDTLKVKLIELDHLAEYYAMTKTAHSA